MKSNTTTTAILNGVLAITTLLSVIFCIQFIFVTRELRSLSGQITSINNYRTGMQALYNDCVVYSEKHPAIDPILESVGKPKTAPTKQPVTR